MKPTRAYFTYIIIYAVLAVCLGAYPADAAQLGEGIPLPIEGFFTAAMWSPAGGGLALAGEKFRGLYYADMSGNLMTISDAPLAGWRFSWSPDGQNIAYRVGGDGMGMAVMIAGEDGTSVQVTPYLNDLFPPEWGKDGLTYRSGDELLTVDENGKLVKSISLSQGRGMLAKAASITGALALGHITGATLAAIGVIPPSKPKDGEKSGEEVFLGPDHQIWVADEDGNLRKLIDLEDVGGYANPAASPAEDRYAIHGFDGNLYVVDPNSEQPVNLGIGSEPTWSPDGQFVLFQRTTDDGRMILTSDLWMASWDGSWIYQLTSTGDIESNPSWSPDGKWIAYVIDGVVYIAPIEM